MNINYNDLYIEYSKQSNKFKSEQDINNVWRSFGNDTIIDKPKITKNTLFEYAQEDKKIKTF